jgi:prophage maintenance system killer protein
MNDQLKRAKENLERLREQFKDEPDLLAVYEPSAVYLVELLESHKPM